MVKLDANLLRYLSNEDIRVLVAVEMGMKNHQLVPGSLISAIAALKGGGTTKILHNLTQNKLLVYERGKRYDGYRLTYLGYDYLALYTLSKRGIITQIGNQIGVGKESDVYIAINDEDERFAVKLHRLGRTSFRKVHEKRDYHKNNNKVHNWIYMSRLAATREFSFLKALHEPGLPVPKPIDSNRHCIVMELVDGTLLNHFNGMDDPASLYNDLMNLLISLANDYGVVHGDFNEFNIMLKKETLKPVLIDFPQMISVDHRQAKEYFDRDVECIVNFFKRFNFHPEHVPQFDSDVMIDESNKNTNQSRIKVPHDDTEDYLAVKKTSEEDARLCDDSSSLTYAIEKVNLHHSDTCRGRQDSFQSNDSDDSCSHSHRRNLSPSQMSQRSYSVAGSTFTTDEIRSKLKKEFSSRIKREELRRAAKSVKGEDSAVRRQKRLNERRIKEDSNLDASIFD